MSTTTPLLAAARGLFAERGFAEVDIEEIARRAELSREELRHLFPGGKEELFRALIIVISGETAHQIRAAVRQAPGPWEALVRGIAAFLDASATPEVRRILLLDGPAILGGEVWRATYGDFAIGLLDTALQRAIDAGQLPRQPTRAAAQVLLGALEEAAMTVAGAEDPAAARAEMGRTVDRLLAGLRASIA
jgi:AcrR family transcriptional regulator